MTMTGFTPISAVASAARCRCVLVAVNATHPVAIATARAPNILNATIVPPTEPSQVRAMAALRRVNTGPYGACVWRHWDDAAATNGSCGNPANVETYGLWWYSTRIRP